MNNTNKCNNNKFGHICIYKKAVAESIDMLPLTNTLSDISTRK